MKWSELIAGDVLRYAHENRFYLVVEGPIPPVAGKNFFMRVLLLDEGRVYKLECTDDHAVSPGIDVLRAEGP